MAELCPARWHGPVGDGLLEVGNRVPVERLEVEMDEWFHKKGYVKAGERVRVTEIKRAISS
jgi:hypothetical protein